MNAKHTVVNHQGFDPTTNAIPDIATTASLWHDARDGAVLTAKLAENSGLTDTYEGPQQRSWTVVSP